jgi:hypothetical protein
MGAILELNAARRRAILPRCRDKPTARNEINMLADYGQNSRQFLLTVFRAGALAAVLGNSTGCFPQKAPAKIPTATSVEEALGRADTVEFAHLSGANLKAFPTGLADCPKLWKLSLRGQTAAAPLPADLGRFAPLRWLDAAGMGLETLPPELDQLKRLEHLYLADNRLAALPPVIGSLPGLTYLNLDRNALTVLPQEIGGLSSLKWLRLNNNQLSDLPSSCASLTSLRRLYLRQNRLATIPTAVLALSALEQLDVGSNPITQLPADIVRLAGLQRLDLDRTSLTALPANIGELKALRHLFLYGCSISPEERERIRKALPDCEIAF